MKKLHKLLYLFVALGFMACDDILEEDISSDEVNVRSPLEGAVLTSNQATFSWNGLDGADNYRLQVNDDANNQLQVDTLVAATALTLNLNNGSYNWRIRGENFAYVSSYNFPVAFSIVPNEDLSGQSVTLATPADGFIGNDSAITLNWNAISTADTYDLELTNTLSSNTITVVNETGLISTNYALSATELNDEGTYRWSVRALNATSETPMTTSTFQIDRTAPSTPVPSAPEDNASTNVATVGFEWAMGEVVGEVQSPVETVLELASDDSFTTLVQTYEVASGTTVQDHTFAEAGTYYWRLKAVDAASNESVFTTTRTLTIQ